MGEFVWFLGCAAGLVCGCIFLVRNLFCALLAGGGLWLFFAGGRGWTLIVAGYFVGFLLFFLEGGADAKEFCLVGDFFGWLKLSWADCLDVFCGWLQVFERCCGCFCGFCLCCFLMIFLSFLCRIFGRRAELNVVNCKWRLLFWVLFLNSPYYFCNRRLRIRWLVGIFISFWNVARLSSRELVEPFKDFVTIFLMNA